MATIRRKLTIVGDGACGKSHLVKVFLTGTSIRVDEPPTTYDTDPTDIVVDGKRVELTLCQIYSHEDYGKLRPPNYEDSHTIILCFSIDSPTSLSNIQYMWSPEIQRFCSDLPTILVGCKKDLRNDPQVIKRLGRVRQLPVTLEEGMDMARRIGARNYVECSARTGEGVREVFQHATRAALSVQAEKSHRECLIM